MPQNKGLLGLRPKDNSTIQEFAAPPYDVIQYGTPLQKALSAKENLIHIHYRDPQEGEEIYDNANTALHNSQEKGQLIEDNEACYYIYEQTWEGGSRIGVMAAIKVTDYNQGQVIRHEKTFSHKVKDRIELRKKLGYQIGNIFGVAEDKSNALLDCLHQIASSTEPLFSFVTDFNGSSDMDGVHNKVFRVPQDSPEGQKIHDQLEKEPVYIADGHHRYHTSLKLGQKYTMMYVSPSGSAKIQAYDRVIGSVDREALNNFQETVADDFTIEETETFKVANKHTFIFYLNGKNYVVSPKQHVLDEVKDDPVKRIDASVLQNHVLFPRLGLSLENIKDHDYFDYYPGNEKGLAKMQQLVDSGKYQCAISLAPVDFDELKAVADAGIQNPEVVMPQKSTYFWPKLLSGIILYKFEM